MRRWRVRQRKCSWKVCFYIDSAGELASGTHLNMLSVKYLSLWGVCRPRESYSKWRWMCAEPLLFFPLECRREGV
jgi:hypothetical protein